MTSYTEILEQLGLAKNEARIYETLLREGESTVGHISTKSEVYRRNVYDSLNRLMEKGLVFELIHTRENRYRAVDPEKLSDMLDEKRGMLNTIMPDLAAFYSASPTEYEVYTYHGREGWKNYMRDMLRINEPAYFIAAKGGWLDERVKDFFPTFIRQAQKQNLKFYHLFDHEIKTDFQQILPYVGKEYKFLPSKYSTPAAVDIFGDHVNIIREVDRGNLGDEIVFSVIKNEKIADSFRTWFRLIWDLLPEEKK